MLYHLLAPLRDVFAPFNVVRYLTFRTAAAVLTMAVPVMLSIIIHKYLLRGLTFGVYK